MLLVEMQWGIPLADGKYPYRYQYNAPLPPAVGNKVTVTSCKDPYGNYYPGVENGASQVTVVSGRVCDVEYIVDKRVNETVLSFRVTLSSWRLGPWWDDIEQGKEEK
jgi:hypothetical protein